MKIALALALAALLSACATAPTGVPRAEHLLNDRLFAAPSTSISARDVFAVSPAMKEYVEVEIADQLRAKGLQRGLYEALYSRNHLKLEYDSATTRNAAQAFQARSGNCLSLVIMTAALAKELGLAVHYQSIVAEENWSRSAGMYFSSGHVNLTLGKRSGDPRIRFDENHLLTIDVMPLGEKAVQRAFSIEEATIIAMYMNNRAAESLAEGKVNDAYWWAREALMQDPSFTSAYNTLGVIYRRHGNPREAERVLAWIVEREPSNLQAMTNLMLVYDDEGRAAESQALSDRIDRMQPYPPFHFFNLGLKAMEKGEYRKAKDLFARELDRDPDYHEFHFWMAVACARLGEMPLARKHLAIALQNSTTRSDHDLYAAKLDRITGKAKP